MIHTFRSMINKKLNKLRQASLFSIYPFFSYLFLSMGTEETFLLMRYR